MLPVCNTIWIGKSGEVVEVQLLVGPGRPL